MAKSKHQAKSDIWGRMKCVCGAESHRIGTQEGQRRWLVNHRREEKEKKS